MGIRISANERGEEESTQSKGLKSEHLQIHFTKTRIVPAVGNFQACSLRNSDEN